MRENFSSRLRLLLDERGRGAASALASACGLSRSYIAELADGTKSNPANDITVKIARFFGVNPGWLLSGEMPRMSSLDVARDYSPDFALRESAAVYGAPFSGTPQQVAGVDELPTPVLWDMITTLPGVIAASATPALRQRFAGETTSAAVELRRRLDGVKSH
jgi:transcriptional regulator with XRE-family HTH domain